MAKLRSLRKSDENKVIRINSKVKIIMRDTTCSIWVFEHPYMTFQISDTESRNLAMVQLNLNALATQDEIANGFSVHVKTAYNAIQNFKKHGFKGLIDKIPGPREAHKILPIVRQQIILEHLRDKSLSLEAVSEKVSVHFKKKISKESIRQVLLENGFIISRNSPGIENSRQLGLFEAPSETKQSELNLLWSFPQEMNSVVVEESLPRLIAKEKEVIQFTFRQRSYLKQLQNQIYSDNGSGFLYIPFLIKIKFNSIIEKVFKETAGDVGSIFNIKQLCLFFFWAAIFDFPSIESSKKVKREHLGVLLGELRCPEIKTVRRFLHKVALLGEAVPLMESFAGSWFEDDRIHYGVFYIDGHLIPYYGIKRLDEAYFTSQGKVLKANTQYFITDKTYHPVYFLLTQAHERFSDAILKVIPRIRQLAHKTREQEQTEENPLTLVFDRGGYAVGFPQQLKEQNVIFITYVDKPEPKGLDKIPDDAYKEYRLKFKSRERTYKICDEKIPLPDYGTNRVVGVWNLKNNKRTYITTNDTKRSAPLVANLMLGRWGLENFIKIMKHDLHIDHFPGFGFLNYEDRQVDNPKIKEIRREKRKLNLEIRKLESRLGQLAIKKKSKKQSQKVKQKRNEIITQLQPLLLKKRKLMDEQKTLPKKVWLSDIVALQEMSRVDFEQKSFVDVFKILAYIAEKDLEKRLSKYYHRNDIRQIVKMITTRGAEIKLAGETLHVNIKHFDIPSVQRAVQKLCIELNEKRTTTIDEWGFRLLYGVQEKGNLQN